jgi:hypothetical protein
MVSPGCTSGSFGALAGFWAGLVAALGGALVYIVLIIASYGEYSYATSSRSIAALIVRKS